MTKRSSILRELVNASFFLALITSFLYISGASYINSYLTEWGVEASLIPLNTQDVLVHGAGVWFIGGMYVVISAVFIGLSFYLPFYMVSEISKSPFARKIASIIYNTLKPKKLNELPPPDLVQSLTKWSLQFLLLSVSLFIFLLMFHRLLNFASSQAAERAQREYVEFSTDSPKEQRIFSRKKSLIINGSTKEGYILANSDNLVVVYFPESESTIEEVLVIPLSTITEIKASKVTS